MLEPIELPPVYDFWYEGDTITDALHDTGRLVDDLLEYMEWPYLFANCPIFVQLLEETFA